MIISLDLRARSLYYVLESRYIFSSFRTTLLLFDGLLISWSDPLIYNYTLFGFYATLFALLVFTLYKLGIELFKLRIQLQRHKLLLFCIAVSQATAIYFLCTSRMEIFAWLCATEAHLVPVIALLIAALLIMRNSAGKVIYGTLLMLAFAVAGGAEHISVLSVLISVSLLVLHWRTKVVIPPAAKKKLLFFFISHAALFSFIVTNPGAWHRLGDVDEMLKASPEPESASVLFLFFQPHKLLGLLLTLAGVVALRAWLQPDLPRINFRYFAYFGVLILGVCISMSLAAYGKYGPGRIWFPFDVFVYFLLAAATLAWRHVRIPTRLTVLIFPAAAFVALAAYAYRHIPALYHYRQAYDELVGRVQQAGSADTVRISNFPAPDLVSTVELGSDPANQSNQLFCRFYNSEAKVSVSANK